MASMKNKGALLFHVSACRWVVWVADRGLHLRLARRFLTNDEVGVPENRPSAQSVVTQLIGPAAAAVVWGKATTALQMHPDDVALRDAIRQGG